MKKTIKEIYEKKWEEWMKAQDKQDKILKAICENREKEHGNNPS